jgi:antitoxin (DNA-binding transcriptional repressor) of toxin-antitoxin stability system
VTIEEAQATLADLVHRLSVGEELLITEGDRVIAGIVGESEPIWQRPPPGLAQALLTVISDDDEHLQDFAEHMPRTSWPSQPGSAADRSF